MPYQPGIRTALKDWGLTVVEVAGWETRGDPYFQPHGHVLHHDVIADQPGNNDRVPSLIVVGRSDLPGPLCNFWLERDGNVHLVAAGEANHAGQGGWRGLSGNHSVWGTEMNNLGTPADPWPDAQLEAMVRLAAATAEFSGFDASFVCGHKEWAPTRKIDPHSIDMGAFRGRVAAAVKSTNPSPEEGPMIVKLKPPVKDKPALLVTGAKAVTVPASLVDNYAEAGVPVVTLAGADAGKHYDNLAKLRG